MKTESIPDKDWRRLKAGVYWSDDLEMDVVEPANLTVFEDNDPIDTGLLDADGNKLYRYPDKQKLGFDL